MPKPDDLTRRALIVYKGSKSQRATCAAMGLDDSWRGTVHRIIHRIDVSLDKENEIRHRLGLRPIAPSQISVRPCPSCAARGIIDSHADGLDCHGNGGTAVVLADGETVRKTAAQRTRPAVRRPWMGAELTAEMDNAGVTDATVRWLVTRHIYEQEIAGHAPALEVT